MFHKLKRLLKSNKNKKGDGEIMDKNEPIKELEDVKMGKPAVSERFFLGSDEKIKYYIVPPTAEAIRGADWQYSKIYTKCLMEDIPTSAEMLDILNRRGIIGSEFEQRAIELAQILEQSIKTLDEAPDLDTKRVAAVEVAAAREELFQWNQRLNGPMNNTAEQISDDARLEYLTSCVIVDVDGNKIWEVYENYLKETDQTLALKSRFEVMLYVQGLDSDFLNHTPEAEAMHEVEAEVISRAKDALEAARAVATEEIEEDAKKSTVETKSKTKRVKKIASKKKSDTR